jgi:SNF2 family DNA or RNA helicase
VGKLRVAVKKYLDAWFAMKRRPLIIFAYHRQVLAGVKGICQRKKLRFAEIRGSDDEKVRLKAMDAFQSGKAEVFIGPLRSAGVGINLHRGSDILCLERLWTPALMEQAEDRAHRIGQQRVVTVTYLDARRTVDEHLASVSETKQVLIDKVVDDQDRATQKRVTIETIDEVIERMRRGM